MYQQIKEKTMTIKEKILRILVEADLYKVGEGDTIASEVDSCTYRITKSINGWWDLERVSKKTGKVLGEKTAYGDIAKLCRKVLANERLTW